MPESFITFIVGLVIGVFVTVMVFASTIDTGACRELAVHNPDIKLARCLKTKN